MVNFNEVENKTVVTFPKKLDTETCVSFESEVMAKVSENDNIIVFDMSGVEFISSFFLRICMKTIQSKGKENLKVENLTPSTKKIFMIAGLGDLT